MNAEAFALLVKLLLEKELSSVQVEIAGRFVSVVFGKNQGFVLKVMDLVDDIDFDDESFVEAVKKQIFGENANI